ncbi:MAG TPA: hypothetical protein VLJ57_10550 [Burkholderiaceae bacterium]|nr:hypothetical protein [Burkholderiaceae bacterium]
MSLLSSPNFLRNVIRADAASGLASSLLHLMLAGYLSDLLGLPRALLVGSGLLLLGYVALAAFISTCDPMPRPLVWTLVAGNAAWALACLLLLSSAALAPTLLGKIYIVVQALAVAVLAELEWTGLRRQAQAVPAW